MSEEKKEDCSGSSVDCDGNAKAEGDQAGCCSNNATEAASEPQKEDCGKEPLDQECAKPDCCRKE